MTQDLIFSKMDLRKLIVPLIIEQILAVTVGMADVMMVSSAGEAAVSGVSLVDMINVLLINIFAALATGGAVVSSQFLGAKDRSKACNAAGQLLFISFILSMLITIIVLFSKSPLLRLLFGKIENDVMQASLTYLTISALSYPFIAVYNSCAALFRSMGNSKVSMYTSAGMNVINIAGNAVFVFGFHMGVAGVALSSLISRFFACLVLLFLLNNPLHEIHVTLKKRFHPSLSMIKTILYIGIPSALESSMFQLGRANNLDAFGCIPGQALSLAMITVIGRCVGAGDYAQAKHYTKKLLKTTYLITIALNFVILLTMPLILKIYNLSDATIRLASVLVLIHNGCAMILWPLSFVLPNALRASNDVRFTMVISIFSMWTFRIVFSYLLGQWLGWGAIGVWIAMILDWIFRVICFTVRFLSGRWQKYKPFSADT